MLELVVVVLSMLGVAFIYFVALVAAREINCKVLNRHESYGKLKWCKHCLRNIKDDEDA